MLNDCYANAEENLLHVIRTNGSAYVEYQTAVEQVRNINYTDANDNSFLHAAVCQRKPEIAIDLMRRGIDVDLETVSGHTAAHLAVSGGQWDLLIEILKFHPNVNQREWRHKNTLLHDVVFYTGEERNRAAKELLKQGANPYAKNDKDISPFDLAVRNENLELIEAFQKIAVPEREEPERFRVPRKAGGYYVIKFREYQKFILFENTALRYIQEKIIEYAAISGGKKVRYNFEITPVTNTPWTVLQCPEKMDFYNYHNLTSWLAGLPEDIDPPSRTICIARHKEEERFSYYGIMDKQRFYDTRLVGRFQNGESFSIYLPEAYKKGGNAKSFGDVLPVKALYLDSCGFNEVWLNMLSKMPSEKIVVEMAVS